MTAVKKIWNDDDFFCVVLEFDGCGVQFTFPIKQLETGASLSRMMNEKVRETVKSSGWAVCPDALRAASKEGLAKLRPQIEEYFDLRGIGNG
jgi:hypothetical protein